MRIHRQHFRGQRWYVLQDQASGRYHRFSPAAHFVVSLMDGGRSVQEIWDLACGRLGDDNLTQDEMIRLLAQLHQSDVLHGDVPPDLGEMAERADRQDRRKLAQSVMNPLAVRLPLLDPDRFLDATLPLVRPLFGWAGLLLFLAVTGSGLVLAGMHWSELTADVADRVLATESILLLLVTYPVIKALHELGHGYATKRWGGEVHEMGVMFLVLMPVPYVDASAASAFREKWRRALVGAAGIMVEMFLAALALFVWLNVEPGLVRASAFNVMLIGGVSTVLFNGNPLLRFDGYYVLSDAIEIPNLATRANRHIGYLVQRHLFGVGEATSPVTARGEATWFVVYGVAAFCYRLFIMVTIVLFIAGEFFVVGVLLAIWACLTMYAWPLAKGVRFLFTSPTLRRRRGRALGVSGAAVVAAAAALLLVPAPLATVTEGVVWAPGDAVVHARADGIVERVLVQPNATVSQGEPLILLSDPLLPARVRVLESRIRELRLRHAATQVEDRAEAKIIKEQIRHAEADLALNRQRAADLVIRSAADGRFVMPGASDQPGRFVRKGEALAYVADFDDPVVRVVVPHNAIDLVRHRTRRIDVRFVERLGTVVPAALAREMPSATERLPSVALGTPGGGRIAMDPRDPQGGVSLEKLFELELKFASGVAVAGIGGRVHVRFDHGREPLATQIYRRLRQLFLRRFNV